MKKYLPSFVVGFGAGVLHVVPIINSLTCCLVLPIAAYFAILLDRKATNSFSEIKIGKGAMIGLLTGIYAALFGTGFEIIITLVTKSNELVNSFPQIQQGITEFPIDQSLKTEVLEMIERVIKDITENGFSLFYSISILVNNLIVDSIFGLVGGLIGAQLINRKLSNNNFQQ